ncbi:hypothetical protein NP493_87g02062 [Ridgeia piscesae]|uniref:Uncharacterized protein n=1 Tax=Ridgeia piscesae TaxID=27915 RepID=A0AAD9P8M2_RIDPI|nr:hypothetical protein NP493_87g02062 [Ridgeia piscesae]
MAEMSFGSMSEELDDWDREMCVAELERLEVETALLEQELKQQTAHPRETTLAQINRLLSELEGDRDLETDRSLVMLEKELKLMRNVSGIELTDATCCIVCFGSDTIRRMVKLKGVCSTVPFRMTFAVTEKHVEGDKFEAGMSDLNCHVTSDMSAPLAAVIKQHEQSQSSTDLMHALAVGTKCGERRQQLYCHLEETYDCVCLPDGPAGRLLQIQPPNSPEWTIFWSEVVTENCVVTPAIQLFVKASNRMVDRDNSGVIESAPGMFQHMLKTLGPAKAIEVLIQTVMSLSWRETLSAGSNVEDHR